MTPFNADLIVVKILFFVFAVTLLCMTHVQGI